MNTQQVREIGAGILFRMGLPACISIGICVAVWQADGALPAWLRAGVLASGLSLLGLSAFAIIAESWRQYKDLDLEWKTKAARLPQPAYIPTKPPEPKDNGETPTPEFLGIVFEHWYNTQKAGKPELPAVRDVAFQKAGLNPSRVQAMYTRCVTWGCIIGRVQGGAAGVINAPEWSHAKARQFMILERPEYGVRLPDKTTVSV